MKKDIAHKLLEEYPEVFADIINVTREVIEEKQKKEGPITMFCIEDEWTRNGIRQGIQQGIQQEGSQFGRLNLALLSEERYDDLKRASLDSEYRHQLYRQYGIVAEGK